MGGIGAIGGIVGAEVVAVGVGGAGAGGGTICLFAGGKESADGTIDGGDFVTEGVGGGRLGNNELSDGSVGMGVALLWPTFVG